MRPINENILRKTSDNNSTILPRISIIGGGNIGTQFACTCAAKGYDVTVFTSKPEKYNGHLEIADGDGNIICEGDVKLVTSDIEKAMQADVVFITHPAYMFSSLAERMQPYIKKGVKVCVIPGTGGAEFAFRGCIEKGAILFGLQRVPCVARLVEYGKRVCVEGKRDCLYLASIPTSCAEDLSVFISGIFDMPCEPLPNYLCVTMTPSNPILHTTRLATMFADYEIGKVYDRNPLFYGEWSDESSERLLACDAEQQRMLKMLNRMDLSSVKSLVIHYDNSDTAEKMTAKMRSIRSLHNLLSPMTAVENGWIPDFKSRYFTADFPYGLAIIEEMADIIGADVPMIKKTLRWYRDVTGDQNRPELSQYGLNTVEDIYNMYL